MSLVATPWKESTGVCECCNRQTRTFWGGVSVVDGEPVAVYYVHYATDSAEPPPVIDVVIGPWGDQDPPKDRVLVSMAYKPGAGGGLMVVDAAGRPADVRTLCGRALARAEVVGTPLAKLVFDVVDAVFLEDPRIADVTSL